MPPLPEPPERPRSVSVIGWVALVVSVLLAVKALIDIAVWTALGPAVPSLLGAAQDPSLNLPYIRTILAHVTQIRLAQAFAWSGVALIAVGLLRLRPWARIAMQIVGACFVLYFAGFLAIWSRAWNAPGMNPAVPPLSEASRFALLAGGIGIGVVLAGVMISMILVLRSSGVRAAFGSLRGDGA